MWNTYQAAGIISGWNYIRVELHPEFRTWIFGSGTRFLSLGFGFRVFWTRIVCFELEFRVLELGFRVFGLGFRVVGLGLRVFGLGFRVFGLGFCVFGPGFLVFWTRMW